MQQQQVGSMDFAGKNYYDIFSQPSGFEIDIDALTREYRRLQTAWHPDRFINGSDRERVVALQATSMLNEAYETLRSPVRRAGYLLGLKYANSAAESTHKDMDFLLRQLQWRESLEDISDRQSIDELDRLKAEVETEYTEAMKAFTHFLANDDLTAARMQHEKMQFLFKLLSEISSVEESLLDY
jgi:molecular chaperone HscB